MEWQIRLARICERLFKAWLNWSGSRFYDLWNGLKCLQNSSGHVHLSHGKCLVWCLPIILVHETYLLLSSTLLWAFQLSAYHAQDTPYQHLLSFSMLCTWLYQTACSILRKTKFSWLISFWRKVSGILLKYPPFCSIFFEKDDSSDRW